MNSAVKQLTRTMFGSVGRWACLASLLLGVKASGQIVRTADSGITIRDATLDPNDPTKSRPRASTPYPVAISIGTTVDGKTIRPEHKIQRVEVVLPNLVHPYFADLDVVLTGPGGRQVILMSDVGVNQGTTPTTIPGGDSVTLTIGSSTGASSFTAFPAGLTPPIVSGNYTPTNLDDLGVPDVWDGLTTPFTTDLDGFIGGSPASTEWKLYVMDDRVRDSGSLGNWQLKVWTSPYLTIDGKTPTEGVAVDMEEDVTKELTIAIDDLDNSTLTASSFAISSSATGIIPNTRRDQVGVGNAGFSVRQDGANWKIALRAVDNANTASPINITLTVNERFGSVTFPITVNKITAVADKPVITAVQKPKSGGGFEDTSTIEANQGQISAEYQLKVDDPDGTADIDALVVSGKALGSNASDTAIVSTGTGKDRVIRLSPLGAATGSGQFEIYVTDPAKNVSDPKVVTFTVAPVVNDKVRANPTAINIPDAGTTVLKSELVINDLSASGAEAQIENITVTLADVNHKNPSDLTVVLQKEGTNSVVLLHNVGGTGGGANALSNTRLTFSDAGSPVPSTGPIVTPAGDIAGETYAPTGGGSLPSGFPTANIKATLAEAFKGQKANGKWILYVIDRTATTPTEAGSIRGGFQLTITPRTVIANLPTSPITFNESVNAAGAPVSYTITLDEVGTTAKLSSLEITEVVESGKSSLIQIADGTKTWSPTVSAPQNWTFKVNTRANAFGTTKIQIKATNSFGYVTTEILDVNINAVNGEPTITEVSKQTVWLGQVLSKLPFVVGDASELIKSPNTLTVTATSSNPKLLPVENIIIEPGTISVDEKTQQYAVSLFPAANETGIATIKLTVTDSGQTNSPLGTIPDNATKLSKSTEFQVQVKDKPSEVASVTSVITIADSATAPTKAIPYPSATAEVKNLSELISTIKVNLYGLTAKDPAHVAVVLRKGNRAAVLMNGQGGLANVSTPTQLRFEDSAPASIGGTLTSGLFKPNSAFAGSGSLAGIFPNVTGVDWSTVTVGGSFTNAFEGQNPNGVWELYVIDRDPTSDGVTSDGKPNGVITSWMLTIETKPNITDIVKVETTEEKDGDLVIDVGDSQEGVPFFITVDEITSPPDGKLLKDYLTDETQLGDKRSIKLILNKDIPRTAKTATAVLRVRVTDGQGNTDEDTFDLVVTQVNDKPVITGLPKELRVPAGTISPVINYTISDIETAVSDLTLSVKSADPSVLPDSYIIQGGAGANRTIQILPNGARNVSVGIVVSVTDKGSAATTDGKDVEVGTGTFTYVAEGSGRTVFASNQAITIPAEGSASPYISDVVVSDVSGAVGDVKVTLYGYQHPFPDDVVVVLESPGSSPKRSILMLNAGGTNPANSIKDPQIVVFSQSAASPIPDDLPAGQSITSQEYQPAKYGSAVNLPGLGSTASIPANLGEFSRINPNGTWHVYVYDDTFPDAGIIGGGVSLSFETAPDIKDLPSTLTLVEDTKTKFPVTIIDSDTTKVADFNLTAVAIENAGLYKALNVIKKADSLAWELEVEPNLNLSGEGKVRLTITDGKYTTIRDVVVKVLADNDAPEIRLPWWTVPTPPKDAFWPEIDEDAPVQDVIVEVRDVDSDLLLKDATILSDNFVISNAVDHLSLNGPATITKSDTFTAVTAKVKPAKDRFGKPTVTITFTDGSKSTSTNILFSVKSINDAPAFVPTDFTFPNFLAADKKSVKIGVTTSVNFRIGDVETDAKLLKATAKSDNTAVIPNNELVIAESGADRTLTFRAVGSSGASNVKITVQIEDADGGKSVEKTFFVDVDAPAPVPGKVYANTTKIVIPGKSGDTLGKASPYASEIVIPNTVKGDVHQVEVIIDGLKHQAPDDLDFLLVGPDGTSMVILSDAGGTVDVEGLRLELSDSATEDLRDDGPLRSGTFRPFNFGGAVDPDTFPDAGVTPGAASALSVFKGKSQVGTWKLFVYDDSAGETGEIVNGWAIRLTTTPVISVAGTPTKSLEYTYDEDGSPAGFPVVTSFTISDPDTGTLLKDLKVEVRADDESIIPKSGIVFNEGASTLSITPAPHRWQNDSKSPLYAYVKVTRADGASWETKIKNVITPRSDDPIISRLVPVTIQEGDRLTLPLRIVDNDNIVGGVDTVAVTVTSSNDSIVRASDIQPNSFSEIPGPLGIDRTISIGHVPGVTDSGIKKVTITVRAKDNSTLARPGVTNPGDPSNDGEDLETFELTIIPKDDKPTFVTVPTVTATAGVQVTAEVTINDPDTDVSALKLEATSLTTEYIKNPITVTRVTASPATGNSKWNVIFTPELNTKGEARISLVAKDAVNTTDAVIMTVNIGPSRAARYSYTGGKIIINDAVDRPVAATPYPAIIEVPSTAVGSVASLRVDITGFTHAYPDDVDAILVSPTGETVKLFSDVGGSTAVSKINFSLVNDGSAPLIPDGGPISNNGVYRPTDNEADVIPNNDPVLKANAGNDFSVFIGKPAAGQWKLYVLDDIRAQTGEIEGFSLVIETAPRIEFITSPADQSVIEDDPFQVQFRIIDDPIAGTDYDVSFDTSDSTKINKANLSSTVAGGIYTVTGRANDEVTGSADVTISVKSKLYPQFVGTAKFKVTIGARNDPPFFVNVKPLVVLDSGTFSLIEGFDYGDPETPKKDVILTTASSNETVIPNTNIVLIGNTLAVFPAGTAAGESTITLTAAEPGANGQKTQTNFVVRVQRAAGYQQAKGEQIVIRDNSTASQYPSTIRVPVGLGRVSKVTVSLSKFAHDYPADVDVLLVGPNGAGVVLLSDVGGGRGLTNAWLNFDDAAANSVPANPATPVPSGSYKPTNNDDSDVFGAPAPARPSGGWFTSLNTAFRGIDPTGDWSLYIVDDTTGQAGLVQDWILNIFSTEPVFGPLEDVTTDENVPVTVAFQINDADTPLSSVNVSVTPVNPALVTAGPVTGTGRDRSVVLTPVQFANGTTTLIFAADDGQTKTTKNINLTVRPVNQAPTIEGLVDASTVGTAVVTLPFSVKDNETPASALAVTATVTPSTLGTASVSTGSTNRELTFIPSGTLGVASVKVSVTDGEFTTEKTIAITVGAGTIPVLAPIPDQETFKNVPAIVPLTITDPDTPISGLTLTWSSSNAGLVRNVQFGITGSGSVSATILLVNNAVGTARVTISVDDGTTKVSQSFNLTVTEKVNEPPVLGPIADQSTTVNKPVVITLSVTDPDTALADLVFTSSTSNPALVSGVTVDSSTGSAIATVSLVNNAKGIGTVTINVTDGKSTSSRTFALGVTDAAPSTIARPTVTTVNGIPTITITWTGGGELESAPTPNGPWTGTGDTDGSHSMPIDGEQEFFRVVTE